MTQSMTAFARHEEQTELGTFSWELRSVNHRYLEVSFRLDETFRPFEMLMRKAVNDRLGRGKVDVALRYKAPDKQQQSLHINEELAKAVIEQYERLAGLTASAAPIDMMQVLNWPDVIKTESIDQQAMQKTLLTALEHAIDDLKATREREGLALQDMIIQRCEQIEVIAESVSQRMTNIVANYRQKLLDRVADFDINLDPERLEQEVVMLAQKADVAEELDRLKSHVVEVKHTLGRDEPIGRRLDFLMQELNREANTLGSKSIDTDTTRYSVDLKVLIEQMREQIQNIE